MVDFIDPLKFCRRHYRIAPAQIGLLRFLVEGYDGILFLCTIDASAAIVELSWSESCLDEAERILAGLSLELGMEAVSS